MGMYNLAGEIVQIDMTNEHYKRSNDIDPCPFCGSTDVEIQNDCSCYHSEPFKYIVCNNCHAHGPRVINGDTKLVISKWNYRHELDRMFD